MRMKIPTVIAVISALGSVVLAGPAPEDSTAAPARWWTTTGAYGRNLNGKMFTLSQNRGGISFYPPNFDSPKLWSSTPAYQGRIYTERRRFWAPTKRFYPTRTYPTRFYPSRTYPTRFYPSRSYPTRFYPTRTYPTRSYPTRFYPTRSYPTRFYPSRSYPTRFYPTRTYPTRFNTTTPYPTQSYTTTSAYPTRPYRTTLYSTYPSWTTAPTTTGVSVCLRYLADLQGMQLFTLSPSSRNPVTVELSGVDTYRVTANRYSYYGTVLKPNILFWRTIGPELWTRLCLIVDSRNNVVQVFSGSKMSIRKMLPLQFVWSGEPVIDFSGFDGQLTDVQMWDYPVSYGQVFGYMTKGLYGPYKGSVLTWSSISYSLRGNTLLEDAYERQNKQPRRKEKEPQLKGKKMKRKFDKEEKRKERKRQQLL